MEEKKKNKKLIILTVMAVLVLVALIIGATYAYFLVGTTNSFGTRTISTSAEEIGSVALTQGSNLTLGLTAADMMNKGSDTIYYASKDGKTTEETTENIGTATVTGEGTYSCSYSLKMDDNASSMYDTFQSMSTKSTGQIILTVNGTEYDFSTTSLFPKTISGTMSGLTSSNPGYITAGLKVINKTSIDQSSLAGTSMTITFTIESFECEAIEPTLAMTLLSNPTTGLNTSSLQGGLYRYQGASAANYVCFGTDDKDTCLSDTDKYMYRVIGISDSGKVKLIKNTPSDSFNWMDWDDELETTIDVDWNESPLFLTINADGFFKNNILVPDGWDNKISLVDWKYGTVSWNDGNTAADEIYSIENNFTNSVSAKIGLMYLHDYYYASQIGGLNCYWDSGNSSACTTSWIALSENLYDSVGEWIMTKEGENAPWRIALGNDGGADFIDGDYVLPIRPVFYLNNTVSYVSGTGTSTDPFIIS